MRHFSLRKVAEAYGMSPSTLSSAMREGRAPKGHDELLDFVQRDPDTGKVQGFLFPSHHWMASDDRSNPSRSSTSSSSTSGSQVDEAMIRRVVDDRVTELLREEGHDLSSGGSRSSLQGLVDSDLVKAAGSQVAGMLANRPDMMSTVGRSAGKVMPALVVGGLAFERTPARRRGDEDQEHEFLEDLSSIVGALALGGIAFLAADYAIDREDSIVGHFFQVDQRRQQGSREAEESDDEGSVQQPSGLAATAGGDGMAGT